MDSLFPLYLARFIHHAVPTVAISQIQSNGQFLLRNIPALEIGIRMALGAQRSSVLRMVLVNGISLATVGVVIGMVAALAAAPLISSLLDGVSPRDPFTFVAVALILLAATLVASWIPAHRATRVDPNAALRCE
jgi:putative ABC transport system permease protein